MPAITPLAERFWNLVDKTGPCWLWTRALDKDGYGRFRARELGTDRAHKVAYILAYGGILEGFVPDHTCFNRACCRPKHLKLRTRADNAGRTRKSLSPLCKRGHARTPENLRVEKDGRKCRLCHAMLHAATAANRTEAEKALQRERTRLCMARLRATRKESA